MTPTAPELLNGCVTALSTPPEAEDVGAYLTGKIGLVALLDLLCAQEAAHGSATRVRENAMLRSILAEAASAHDDRPDGALTRAEDVSDGDMSLAALDTANAELRRRLTQLHEAVEAAGNQPLDRKILALYRDMAKARELQLPPSPAPA